MLFDSVLFLAALGAGSIASVVGFGVGSILTPTMGIVAGTKIAVAAVSIPHFIGTSIRFWMLRRDIDRRTLLRFGVPSAAGGLTGALLHHWLGSPWLTVVFGGLLVFVAASEFSGLSRRMRFHGAVAWIAGALSGMLGGLVGNQGGIRSAALLGFDLPKHAFVATATAVGVVVDLARMPVYLATTAGDLAPVGRLIVIATAGVVLGTVLGNRILARIPETRFRLIVAAILAVLGTTMLAQGLRDL